MSLQTRRERCRVLTRKYYAGIPTREEFLDNAVSEVARPDSRLLDAGCGCDFPLLHRYGSLVSFAVGVDRVQPSTESRERPRVIQGDLRSLPFRDSSFDLIVSRSVIEHLEQPLDVFRELSRLLGKRGKLIFTTPNRYYYSSVVARLIPFRLKAAYMKRVFGDDGYDHFPVFYRANTGRAFRRLAAASGLRITSMKAIRHYPFYLVFSPFLFRLGVLYDRAITALGADALQSTWLVVMEKE